MATKNNGYTEETALKKSQKKVPEPKDEGKEGNPIPLRSGAVPPSNEAVKPTQVVATPQPIAVQGVNIPPTTTQPQATTTPPQPQAQLDALPNTPRLAQAAPQQPYLDNEQFTQVQNNVQNVAQNVQGNGDATNVGNNQQVTVPNNQGVDQNNQVVGNEGTVQNVTQNNVGNKVAQPYFKTDPALEQQYKAEVDSWGLNGNVDMYTRPMVDSQTMKAAHWDNFPDGATATMFSSRYTDGEGHSIVATPILQDGRVMTPDELRDYINDLYETSETLRKNGFNKTPLEIDAECNNLIVGLDLPEGTEGRISKAQDKYYLGNPTAEEKAERIKLQYSSLGKDALANIKAQIEDEVAKSGKEPDEETAATLKALDEMLASDKIGDSPIGVGGKSNEENGNITINENGKNTTQKTGENTDKNVGGSTQVTDSKKTSENTTKTDDSKSGILTGETTVKNGNITTNKPAELTAEEKTAKVKARNTLKDNYSEGNRKFGDDSLPVVSEAKMVENGWTGATGKGNQMFYPQLVTIKDKEGVSHKVLMSPIMPDGSIVSQEEFKDYVESLKGMDILDVDKNSAGLIIKMDATPEDLDALDKLTADLIKGENPSEVGMTYQEKEKVDNDSDPNLEWYDQKKKEAQENLDLAKKRLDNPDEHVKSVFVDEWQKRLDDYDKETESVKKSQKRNRLIASIGDLLQGLINSVGVFYGAKSAELSSLAGAAGASQEKELTQREKRRDSILDSLDKAKNKQLGDLNKDYEYWLKYLQDLNKEESRYRTKKTEQFRKATLDEEKERNKTKEQKLRRAAEFKLRAVEKDADSKRRMAENEQKSKLKKEERLTPNVSVKSSTFTANYNGTGGSHKKKPGGGRTTAKRIK